LGQEWTRFLVTEHNRAAVAACREIAELRERSPAPVVLVGGSGAGKTHLLRCLARYLREGAGSAVACVSPSHFPPELRELSANPAPGPGARRAVLLVDALERFNGEADTLEALVRAFTDRGHPVVAASAVPPERLENLTPGLRTLLARGRVVPMPVPPQTLPASPAQGAVAPAGLAREVARLHRLLAHMRARTAAAAVAEEEARQQAREDRALAAALLRANEAARAERRVNQRQLHALYAELLRLRETLERYSSLAAALPELTSAGQDVTAVSVLVAERARVMEAAKDAAVGRAVRIAQDAHQLRAENARQREETDVLVARLWDLLGDVASSREQLTAAERLYAGLARQLDAAWERRRIAEAEAAAARGIAREFEIALNRARQQHAALRSRFETLRATVRQQAHSRACSPETAAAMDRLAGEKARADALAERLEHRLRTTEEELVRARFEMDALVGQNEQGIARIAALQERLEAARGEHVRQTNEIAALRAARARAEAHALQARKVIHRLYQQVERVTAQRDAVLARLDRTIAERDAARAQIGEARRAQCALAARWTEAENAAAALRGELLTAVQHHAQLRDEVVQLRAALDGLQRQIDILRLHLGNAAPERPPLRLLHPPRRKPWLGDILCRMGAITKAQLGKALIAQARQLPQRLGELLVEQGAVTEDRVLQAVARQQGVPYLRLHPDNVAKFPGQLVPEYAAREYHCVPLFATEREVVVAMADPLDRRAIAAISHHARKRVRVVASPRLDIEKAFACSYAA